MEDDFPRTLLTPLKPVIEDIENKEPEALPTMEDSIEDQASRMRSERILEAVLENLAAVELANATKEAVKPIDTISVLMAGNPGVKIN
ncbi:MAG: hypothetical protein CVU54_16045 [Deltaproteobacteria bacterium HGW-Deltaproteobacteria-12]|jgi:predicted transcriptional regulator|nr:MAG: hypothetical protein CVU54_16045 [Deltaproteobacteria bacterium HGW-Deltaproteobacteria-12]